MSSIKYSGPLSESSGYSQANRNIIQALHDSGVRVTTELQVYANHVTDYGPQHELAKSLINKYDDYKIKVLHITPNVYAKHKEVGKYHVGHLFWETTGMAKNWAWYLNEVREIWTGCEWNKKCFIDSGFTGEIRVFPQPISFDIPTKRAVIPEIDNKYVFYSIFQWIERKDPKTLLQAFWKEFEGDPNVCLIIKTFGLDYTKAEQDKIYKDIKKWKNEVNVSRFPKVGIIDYLLSTEDIHSFHEAGDCFVSAHHGEGWGIPQVEALTHKKPVISTGLGGMHEWIDNMYKVKYSMCNVSGMDWAEQYGKDQQWGQCDISDLRRLMRYVYNNRDEAKQMGERGFEEVKSKFNFKVVGEQMKKRIREIEETL